MPLVLEGLGVTIPAAPSALISPAAFGARSDGVTDDTAAVNAALAAVPLGTAVVISAPTVIGGQLVVPSGVSLVGDTPGPFDLSSTSFGNLPMLLVPNSAVSPIALGVRSSAVVDLGFYYPNQIAPTGVTPTVYPATIVTPSGSAGHKLRRLYMANAYQGLSLGGGRHYLEDLLLGCFNLPIAVDFSHDVIHMRGVQCNPFWDTIAGLAYPQTVDTFVGANQTVLQVARADGMVIDDLFAFHGNIGVNLIDGTDAPAQSYGAATNVRLDTFAIGIRCVSTQSPGWQFDDFSCNASTVPVSLPAGGASLPRVRIRGGSFWGAATTPANAGAGVLDIKGVQGFNPAGTAQLAGGQPAVPGSTTPLTNRTGVDCTVQVVGGTVTQIAVAGSNTGLTSGFFRVPAGQTITLTYSVAPTWTWWGD